jgi:uncharacterized phage protein gp47/JayE
MATIAATMDASGVVVPDFADVLAQLKNEFWTIYGTDAVLTDDSQDGQFLSILAQAITDVNQLAAATVAAFSPTFAQGVPLSSIVKINGIARLASSASTATVTIVGTVGTVITGGMVGDSQQLGTQWALPPSVTIPGAGTIAVTATSTVDGDVAAAPGTLTQILTPTNGWQTVTNAASATRGAPVETDAALRRRQAASVALPSESTRDGISSNVGNLAGVTHVAVYENDQGTTDSNGIPGHSIAVVVEGGDAAEIAEAIFLKKCPGTGTFGTTSETVIDSHGMPQVINFFYVTVVTVAVEIHLDALTGYVSTTGDKVKASVAAFISALGVGQTDYLARLYAPANLSGSVAAAATGLTQTELDALASTYTVTALLQSSSGPPGVQDVVIDFNEIAECAVANITLIVT